jgi:hypothetical protein
VAERRVEPRIQSANLINYSELAGRRDAMPEDEIYAVLGTARTLDLSGGGCKILCRDRLPDGAQLHFDLQLGDVIVSCDGTVAHVVEAPGGGGWEVGIRFDGLDELAADGIRLYLATRDE